MKDILPKLKVGLENAQNQTKVIKIFTDAGGYASQYDLFDFIINGLKITGPVE